MKLCLAILGVFLVCVSAIETEPLALRVQKELETIDVNDIQIIEDFKHHDNLVFKDLPVENDSEENGNDGIKENVLDLKQLTPAEFKDYLLADERHFRQVLKSKRVKRSVWGLIWRWASKFVRTGLTTIGANVVYDHVTNGDHQTAVEDFNRLRPQNLRSTPQGQTGTVGDLQVTLHSQQQNPTLEIQGPAGAIHRYRYRS